jgi:uncharacterized protein
MDAGVDEPTAQPSQSLRPSAPLVWPVFATYLSLWLGAVGASALLAAGAAAIRAGMSGDPMQRALEDVLSRPAFLLASSLTFSTWAVALVMLVVRAGREPPAVRLRLGPALRPRRVYAGAIIATLGASQLLSSLLALTELDTSGTLGQAAEAVAALDTPAYLVAVVVLGLAAPFAEELFFRGFVQTRLTERWGPWRSVVVTALLFGLLHGDPVHAPAAFGVGLVLGWATEASGSLRPAIAAHMVNNLVWVISLKMPGDEPPTWVHAVLMGLCAMVVAASIALTGLRSRSTPPHTMH